MARDLIQCAIIFVWLVVIALRVRRGDCNRRALFFQGVLFGFFGCLLILKIVIYFRSGTVVNIYNHMVSVSINRNIYPVF